MTLPYRMFQTYLKREDYRVVEVIRVLKQDKFPLYLTYSHTEKKQYIMKIFPYDKATNKINPQFTKEADLALFNHPNIINIVHVEPHQSIVQNGRQKHISYLLFEMSSMGTFRDLMLKKKIFKDEMLVRTYFHHLIEGITCLHYHGIAHMSLKLDNLILGDDFQLKITGFDFIIKQPDFQIPKNNNEEISPHPRNTEPYSHDIFAAGVILFILVIGHHPFIELNDQPNFKLEDQLKYDPDGFWKTHQALNKKVEFLSKDLKDLFIQMMDSDIRKQATLEEIKNNKWYIQDIYNPKLLKKKMSELLSIL